MLQNPDICKGSLAQSHVTAAPFITCIKVYPVLSTSSGLVAGSQVYDERRPVRACTVADMQPHEEEHAEPLGLSNPQHEAVLRAIRMLALASTPELADERFALASAALRPFLASAPDRVVVNFIEEALMDMSAAAADGKQLEAAKQQQLLAAVRRLLEGCSVVSVGSAAGCGEAGATKKRKADCLVAASSVADQPCAGCGDPSGEHVICDCCMECFHLACHQPPLEGVPEAGTWLCSSCIDGGYNVEAVEAALALHGRWVTAKFPGIARVYWGQANIASHATLVIQYDDGEARPGYTVEQMTGQAEVEGHSWVKMRAEGSLVPVHVMREFHKQNWLVVQEPSG